MREIQELQLQSMVGRDEEANLAGEYNLSNQATKINRSRSHWNWWRWIRVAIHTLFVLSGQAAGTLLGRQYYDKGGNSKWLATLVSLVGFPLMLPYYCIKPKSENPNSENAQEEPPSFLILASVYVGLGIVTAADCYLYSIGLLYLPVSTYSIICASQLAFNSFFSYFLNKQKFTPYIINSLVLLTISSTLLVFENDTENTTRASKQNFAVGFICTVGASAGYGLQLSLTQLAFTKVIKSETFRAVVDMIIYPSFVSSCVAVVGLFGSREWMSLKREMEEYELGEVSYVMNLVWSGICWQIFTIGLTGLILETSSLFSNAVSALGLPIIQVLAVVFFHDKMDGLKVIAIVLATWGFVSFFYQQYLDDCKPKRDNRQAEEVTKAI